MRIIEVVPSLANRSRGLTYTATRLSAHLHRREHDLPIACLDAGGHAPTPDWVRPFPQAAWSGKLMASPRLRAECLNAHVFESLQDAEETLTSWRRDYHAVRPHIALGMLSPKEFAELGQRNLVG